MISRHPPELLAFAELTRKAAHDLRDRLFPTHSVFSLDDLDRSQLQVAVLYDPSGGLTEIGPFTLALAPRGTRPMAVVDYTANGQRIRFYACHWTARFSDTSDHVRSELGRALNAEIYRFIHEADTERRHAVVLGDLNDEPFDRPITERLYATRARADSRRPEHYTDQDTQRIRLYNCAWRYLGESHAHTGGNGPTSTVGTHYWQDMGKWATLDHVIVTGSLLGTAEPFLDETSITVLSPASVLEGRSFPLKYMWNDGSPSGVSDHLPVSGKIVLKKGRTDGID